MHQGPRPRRCASLVNSYVHELWPGYLTTGATEQSSQLTMPVKVPSDTWELFFPVYWSGPCVDSQQVDGRGRNTYSRRRHRQEPDRNKTTAVLLGVGSICVLTGRLSRRADGQAVDRRRANASRDRASGGIRLRCLVKQLNKRQGCNLGVVCGCSASGHT